MAELGLNAYRFSVAWSRVIPDGYGEVNEAGIKFYNDLIDELLKYGIEPYLMLYHWDLPQKLFERGGWISPDMPVWFYEYAKLIGEQFGDRVKHFISFRENDLTGGVVLFSDPIFLGDYPEKYYEYYRDILPDIKLGDMELISSPIDFCFQNIYSGQRLRSDGEGGWIDVSDIARNMLGWGIVPEALYWGSRFLYERYKKPICIMENGFAREDKVSEDGHVHDPERSDFIRKYTSELLRAREDGIDIRGYFYRSITDNLEWELGFGPRFGIIHVDCDTLVRTPKDSYYTYRDIIASSEV